MPSRTLLALLLAALLGLAAPPAAMAQDQAPQQQPAAPQSVQRIAAVVNDDIVSTQELRDRLALTLLFSNLPADPETQQRVAPQVLRRVIDEQLQLQEARRRNIRVPRQEVDGALANAAAANNMSVNQLFAFLTEQGIDPQALRRQIEAQLTWFRVVREIFAENVVVTDQQVELALAANQQGGQAELLLSEIVLPIYDPARANEVLAEAEELRAAIRQGGDFAAIAQQVSASPSGAEGGDLGWVRVDSVQTALRPLLSGLGAGQMSDPIATPAGVQFFLVRDRRITTGAVAPDVRELAQLLFPLALNATEAETAEVLARARAAAEQIETCGDIERLARQLALPNSGNIGWLRAADLPVDMAQTIATLPVGTLSRPVRGVNGIHLLMSCKDGVSSEDEARRALLRRTLEEEQIQKLAARYLRDLRQEAFIDVRIGN
ncbi:MAG: peptidylprolyl isomerase [Geminicoccaceae bacterium]